PGPAAHDAEQEPGGAVLHRTLARGRHHEHPASRAVVGGGHHHHRPPFGDFRPDERLGTPPTIHRLLGHTHQHGRLPFYLHGATNHLASRVPAVRPAGLHDFHAVPV